MSDINKLPKGYHELFEDLSEYEGLDEAGMEYIQTFYLEYYNDKISFDNPKVLKGPDILRQARRNHNSVKRDATRVAKKKYTLDDLSVMDKKHNRDYLDESNEEPGWMVAYKIGGYEAAARQIITSAIESITTRDDDSLLPNTLLNFLLDFRNLKKVHRKDKYEKGKYK